MVMLLIALCLLVVNTLYAVKFDSPHNYSINDFSYTNNNLYVTTPLKTYLLNGSLEITDEFSKQLNTSLMMYVDSDIFLECGERHTDTDDCCFLRHASDLTSIQSDSSYDLCFKFTRNIHYYPCNDKDNRVFLLVSYYKYPKGGAFSRMYFPQLREGDLSQSEEQFRYNIAFRSIVVSPAMGKYKTYVVVKQSASILQALYIDPDLNNLDRNLYAELYCDDLNTNVLLGFGLDADSSVDISSLNLNNDMTHFIMYKNTTKYRICAFSEDSDMKKTNSKLAVVYKDSLITLDSSNKDIQSFNGITVNGGLAIYFSVKRELFKIVMTGTDAKIRDTSQTPIFTASSNITKIEFSSTDLGFVSTANTIESFVPHQCGTYIECGVCTGTRDPHCGWCTLENKCSTKDDCTIVPSMWTQDPNKCLEISITDDHKDVMAEQQLVLDAVNIALPTDKLYTCVFVSSANERNTTNATYSNNQITCPVPTLVNIDSGLLQLDVSVTYQSSTIGHVKINYHQCDLYSECSDCSSISKFCTWCPLEASCTKQEHALCREYKVVDPAKCPRISSIMPTRIPRNTIKATVIVYVENLPGGQLSTVYQCEITSKKNTSHSRTYDIGAESQNETIFCTDVQIDAAFPEYQDSESPLDISIVYRGGVSHSPNGVAVVVGTFNVYACELLASDCVQCVGLYSGDYSCRFCTDTCAYFTAQVCETGTVIADNPNTCLESNTEIEQVIPNWSPGEGGIPITIIGKSLAVQDQRITIKFLFKGQGDGSDVLVDCVNSTILNSTCLKCVTPSIMSTFGMANMNMELSSTIVINYEAGDIEKHTSTTVFLFTPLDIVMVIPDYGPESGGTRITVNGTRLCVPGETNVAVNDVECTETRCNITSQTLECLTPPGTGPDQTLSVNLGAATVTAELFSYKSDPVVTGVFPNCTLEQGGINMTVIGYNFAVIQDPLLLIMSEPNSTCTDQDLDQVAPTVRTPTQLIYKLPPVRSDDYLYGFKMDGVASMCEPSTLRTMTVLEPPSLISSNFDDGVLVCVIGSTCFVNLTMTQIHRFAAQVAVTIGSLPCINRTINTIKTNEMLIGSLSCIAPSLEEIKGSVSLNARAKRSPGDPKETDLFIVTIGIGEYTQRLGRLEFVEKGFNMLYLYVGAGIVGVFMMIFIILVVKNRRDKHHMTYMEKKHQHDMDNMEANYAKAARNEFTELTLMPGESTSVTIDPHDIPYRIFSDYLVHIMFPNVDKRKIMNQLQLEQCEMPDYKLLEFRKFLNDDVFLLTFIDVIERQRDFQVAHRCEVASYVTIALYHDFNYLSHILFQLLNKLIANDVQKSPKLLLRATKSVAEKLLTNWLSLSLYDYLSTMTGPALYELCYKITLTVEQGPVDFVTHHARYALSQDKILSEEVEYIVLKVEGEGPDGARSKGLVSVLDCDTISQAKGKIYRAIYQHQPYSQQPSLDSISLLWTPAQGIGGVGSMELCDFDERMADSNSEKKFNTLQSYKVQNNDLLKLTMFNDYHQAPMGTIRSVKRQTVSEVCRSHLVKNNQDFGQDFRSPAPKRSTTVTTTKIASEAFLPSLIRTKDHLCKSLDSMMNTIFMESNNIPPAIKYMFDYLDLKTELLSEKERQDSEIAHIWKTNSLPLRFWINIIKNPQFLFDIEKPPIMDSYLSVIGQCFMDSFSRTTMTLNKDSSANKLVYNREVTVYRNTVDKWYRDVRQSPSVTLRSVVNDSKLPPLPFRSKFAVSQLFKYAQKYQAEIAAALPAQGQQQHTRSDFEVLTKPL